MKRISNIHKIKYLIKKIKMIESVKKANIISY